MKKTIKWIIVFGFVCQFCLCAQQLSVTKGPLHEQYSSIRFNRFLGDDDKSLFCYNINEYSTNGYVEKYNKISLEREAMSRELRFENEETEDVIFCKGRTFIFTKSYRDSYMNIYLRTMDDFADISNPREIISVAADDRQFVDIEIFPNPSRKKMLIKVAHKKMKADKPRTSFIVLDPERVEFSPIRTVDHGLHSGNYLKTDTMILASEHEPKFNNIRLYFDDQENIYYCKLMPKEDFGDAKAQRLSLFYLKAGENEKKSIDLPFDSAYYIMDAKIARLDAQHIIVVGFVKDRIEKRGHDKIEAGIFYFKVNTLNGNVVKRTLNFLSDSLLDVLEAKKRGASRFMYKMDEIIIKDNDVYLIAEQYRGINFRAHPSYHLERRGGGMNTVGYLVVVVNYFSYEYMDVLMTRIGKDGEIKWITNTPLRINMVLPYSQLTKPYMTMLHSGSLFVINNDEPSNYGFYKKTEIEPNNLSPARYESKFPTLIPAKLDFNEAKIKTPTTNLVCHQVSLTNGKRVSSQKVIPALENGFDMVFESNPKNAPPDNEEPGYRDEEGNLFLYYTLKNKSGLMKIRPE